MPMGYMQPIGEVPTRHPLEASFCAVWGAELGLDSASHRDNALPSVITGGKAATATASAMSRFC